MSLDRRWWLLAILTPALAPGAGCDPEGASLPPRLEVVGSSVDQDGAVSPTGTLWLRFSRPLDPATVSDTSVVLVRGVLDDLLRGRLERQALTDGDRDRLAALRLDRSPDPAMVTAVPLRPLEAGTRYTLCATTALAAAGQRLEATAERAFQTGPVDSGAPWFTLLAPGPWRGDVVRNLREVTLRFSRPVVGVDGGSLRLLDDLGEVIAARVGADAGGTDYRLWPAAPLRALRRYHLEAGPAIVDAEGHPVFAVEPAPGFTTSAELRSTAPRIDAFSLTASSGCLVARLHAAPPVDAVLCVGGDCAADGAVAPAHELARPLGFGQTAAVTVTARDESTAPAATLGPQPAPVSSARTLVIDEVLSRPRGSHYAQQFVAVKNVGEAAVSLAGLTLRLEQGQSSVPAGAAPLLGAGGRALLVPSSFAVDDGLDAPAPAQAMVVRLPGGRLGGGGIHVGGEDIALEDADGRLVSRFSTAQLTLAAGQSARRVDPCDRAGAYQPTPLDGTAAPGGP